MPDTKIYLKDVFTQNGSLNRMSREALLKLINLVPGYFTKNLHEIIDEKIATLTNVHEINLSNIRINDIRSEIAKKKYKQTVVKEHYNFSMYQNNVSFYLKENKQNLDNVLTEMVKEDVSQNLHIVQIRNNGRIIKNIEFEASFTNEFKAGIIYNKIKEIKKIENLQITFTNFKKKRKNH